MQTETTTVSSERREAYATAIGAVAILLWAALALTTVRARGIPPFELLALSFGVAFLSGLVWLAASGRLREMRQPLAPWLTAFGGIFLYHALYFFALSAAPAAEASLIAYLWPLLIVLFSAALPGEGLRAHHLGGAVLGLAGTGLVLLGRVGGETLEDAGLGYLAALGCALVWSGYSVLNQRYRSVPSDMIVGVCAAIALAGALFHIGVEDTVVPAPAQWLAIAALGIGPTGLAFLAWDFATKHGRLPVLGALSYLAPLISTMLLILTGEAEPSWRVLAAAALVICGAVLATGDGGFAGGHGGLEAFEAPVHAVCGSMLCRGDEPLKFV